MHITLFGGSFNPPHLGHAIVLEQICKLKLIKPLDEIWLLPEYQHSFAKNIALIPASHRLAMTRFLLRPKVKLQTCCIDKKMSGNTIDHITYLKKTFPRHQFSFLLGSDNLKTFDLWPQWQTLLRLMPFYIYPRKGFDFKPLYPNMMPLTDSRQIITDISSTMVRNLIRQSLPWEHLVPPEIAGYILTHQLY
jgi:nicotinate-nucleotide adenylyltransferase